MRTKIGFAKAEIPVADGTPLIGYEGKAPRFAAGTHDPLYARAVLLEQQDRRFALVCCDLLAVDPDMVARLATRAGEWGVAPQDFFMAATHTHSGPGGYFTSDPRFGALLDIVFGAPDTAVTASVEQAVTEALAAAAKDVSPCTMASISLPNAGIGTDRNHPELPGDPTLTLFLFIADTGARVLLYNTACHPTILNAENRCVSADFPGAAAAALEQSGIDMALFFNGSAGDVSTRFTRQGTGFDDVTRLGSQLAAQVIAAQEKLPAAGSDFAIDSSAFELQLAVRHIDPAQQASELARLKTALEQAAARGEDAATLRLMQSRCEGAMLGMLYAQNQPAADFLPVMVRFLRLGEHVLCFYPVELFSALSNPLRAAFDRRAVPVSYANGYLGYLPDAAIANTDNYEKYTTIFEYDQGARLLGETARHLEERYGLSQQ